MTRAKKKAATREAEPLAAALEIRARKHPPAEGRRIAHTFTALCDGQPIASGEVRVDGAVEVYDAAALPSGAADEIARLAKALTDELDAAHAAHAAGAAERRRALPARYRARVKAIDALGPKANQLQREEHARITAWLSEHSKKGAA